MPAFCLVWFHQLHSASRHARLAPSALSRLISLPTLTQRSALIHEVSIG